MSRCSLFCLVACGLLVVGCAAPEGTQLATRPRPATSETSAAEGWRRWGGPNGDFKVAAEGLSASWPLEGPPLLWSRDLGPGYSAIAGDDEALYTMYRDGEDDVVIAIGAADGETRWEHRYPAPTSEKQMVQFGEGPNASPLLLDGRLITLGYTGLLRCLDAGTGKLLWSHDLPADFGGDLPEFGYSASPIEHDGNVIVLVGGARQGVLALSPVDGSTVWRGKPTSVSYATPIVIDLDGRQQLVYFSADEIIALDAGDGAFLWSFPVVNQYRNNCTPPQWGDDGLLWVATQLDGGTRALRLTRDGDATQVEEVWSSDRMSIHYWNSLRLGGHVYASIGSNGGVLAGIDLATGEIRWRERGFEKVNFLHLGDRTILLDAEGQLALVSLGPQGLQVVSQTEILDGPTWTAPTLVGTRLFIRNKRSIVALDLGARAEG